MSFIDEVASKSCFEWIKRGEWDLGEGFYAVGDDDKFTIGDEDEDEIFLQTEQFLIARIDKGCITSSVVADVVDTLVKNYREV